MNASLVPDGEFHGLPKPGPERTFLSLSGSAESLPVDAMAPQQRQMLAYWLSKRGAAAGPPPRSSIDPAEIGSTLPYLMLWDATVGEDYRCRLAGTAVEEAMGQSLKGTRLGGMPCSLIDEARREFDAVRDQGLLSLVERTMTWLGKPYRYYRNLLMPLADDQGRIRVLMGVFTTHDVRERDGFPGS